MSTDTPVESAFLFRTQFGRNGAPARLAVSVWLLAAAAPLSACQKQQSEQPAEPKEHAAAASSHVVADREIESALQEASKAAAGSGADMPPRDGILTLTRADSEMKSGAPAKVALGASGQEPRYKLTTADVSQTTRGEVELAVRTGPTAALPTVVFKLKAEPMKGAPVSGPIQTHLDVVESGLGKDQPGMIPEQLKNQVSALKGSAFDYTSDAGKVVGSLTFTRSKAAAEDGDLLLAVGGNALDAGLLSFPEEAVGKDAFWMVTSRGKFLGNEVIAYRMVKVIEAAGDGVVLEVNTRRYAVGERLTIPGLEGTELAQFQSNDRGQVKFASGARFPVEASFQQSLSALVNTERGRAPFQVEAQVQLRFPASSNSAAKH